MSGGDSNAERDLRRRPSRPIVWSLLGLLVVAGVVPLVVFGWRMTAFNQRQLELQQDVYQLTLAEAVAREVQAFVGAKSAQVAAISQGVETALALEGQAEPVAVVQRGEFLEQALRRHPEILKVVFLSAAGEGWNAAQAVYRESDQSEELLGPRALEQAMLSRRLVSRSIALPLDTRRERAVVLAQPVHHEGRPVGVVSAVVSLEALERMLGSSTSSLYSVFVLDGRGSMIARSGPELPENWESSALVRAFLRDRGVRNMAYAVGAEGERNRLGAYATVQGVDWGAFVAIDEGAAYYAVHKMKQSTLVWSIGAVLLAALLASVFASQLARPLRLLAEGALRIARGHYDERLGIRSSNEVGQVADAFNHMAGAVERQVIELEKAARENKELFLSTVRMLAEAIDEKDPYTRGHSERVTRFAVATAAAMGMDERAVEKVQIAALLHDVGKIGIDDRILRKPTMLTEDEFAIMKQHPEKGAHIMSAVKQLHDIIPGMRFHHEKVDGTGYPLGLKGDDIPVPAQIISVADTFDAMTTDRPYQKGMDPEFVIDKLKGWIGSRFRGDVVEAFERAYRAGEIVVRRPQVPTVPPSRSASTAGARSRRAQVRGRGE